MGELEGKPYCLENFDQDWYISLHTGTRMHTHTHARMHTRTHTRARTHARTHVHTLHENEGISLTLAEHEDQQETARLHTHLSHLTL